MKLVSWNVNGLRACIQKGFWEAYQGFGADFVCLQEVKMLPEQAPFEIPGVHQFWNSAQKKGYSGTLVLTPHRPMSFTTGIDGAFDDEGRVITLEYPAFYLVCAYVPNAQPELKRLDYRMAFEDALRAYLSRLAQAKHVIYCGDLNVAHQEIDLKHPKANVGNPGFSNEEREKFTQLLQAGFVDSFRYLYPQAKDAYSWWSYRANARANNVGWRIDYFVVSASLAPHITQAQILPEIFGSDHCPVTLTVDITQETEKIQ